MDTREAFEERQKDVAKFFEDHEHVECRFGGRWKRSACMDRMRSLNKAAGTSTPEAQRALLKFQQCKRCFESW